MLIRSQKKIHSPTQLIRSLHDFLPGLLAIALTLLCSACGSISMNDTAYDYTLVKEKLNPPPKTLLLAPRNFGIPSKSYLKEYEPFIDGEVTRYLQKHGYNVVTSDVFESAWRRAERKYGSPYNASESQINPQSFRQIVLQVFEEVREQTDAQAIVFTDLVEQMVVFTGSNSRRARWHGVSRQPKTRGGNQLSADFDWTQAVPAVSLRVIIYTPEADLVFKSFGGLEVSRQINTDKARFSRRSELFTSARNVQEGVAIALHPFVPLKN